MNSIDTRLSKAVKEIQNDNVDDIILFGSYMKGKHSPADIDVLIIFKEKVDKKIESELKRLVGNSKVEINSTTVKEFEGEGFIAKEGVFLEGKSLVTGRMINDVMGFVSVAFIKYDISKLKGSDRVRFYYALQGRGKSGGFLKEVGAKRYSGNVIICDYNVIDRVKPFFEQWGLGYSIVPSMIPKRLNRILL